MSATIKAPLSQVVIKTTGGGTPERDIPELWNGGIPWASVKDFKDGVYRLTKTKEQISEKGLKLSASHLIPAGTPIICTRMAVGRIAKADVPVAINQDLRALYIREEFDTDYVVWAVDAIRHRIENVSIGSTVKGISIDQLLSFEIDVPPKPEQTKIAEILSTVDRAIEQTEALIAKQQRLKTGLMQDLLTRGIDEHGDLRSEQTHEFKDSPLGRIPVEWEVKALGHLLLSINQGWSPDCESDPAAQGEWGILKTTAVVWEGYQGHENKALPPMLTPRPHLEIKSGDLLMTRAGPNSRVGVISYVYSTRSNLMLSDKIYRLMPTKEADGRFLCYALSSSGSQRHLSNLKTGMAESQTNISQEIVKALLTVCPPSWEQSQIADRIDHISGELRKSSSVVIKLRSLKTALMQDLLTGRKRVTSLIEKSDPTR